MKKKYFAAWVVQFFLNQVGSAISRFLKKKTFSSDEYTRNKLIKLQMSLMSQNNLQYFFKPTTARGAKQIMKILSLRKTPDLVIQKTINHLISIKQ